MTDPKAAVTFITTPPVDKSKIRPVATIAFDDETGEWVAYAVSGDDDPMNGHEVSRFPASGPKDDVPSTYDTLRDFTRLGFEIGEEFDRIFS